MTSPKGGVESMPAPSELGGDTHRCLLRTTLPPLKPPNITPGEPEPDVDMGDALPFPTRFESSGSPWVCGEGGTDEVVN